MANPIIQAIYDLKDNISAKIKTINDALRGNQKESDRTADVTEKSNKRASDSYKKTASDVSDLRKALGALAAFVGLDKLKDGLVAVLETGEQFDDLGKKFATAFGGLDAGAQAFEAVRAIAAGVPQSFEDVSAAAIKLRQLGFDPLDGTLQALLDNQNALNQSQDDLIATIDALGAANTKGVVSIKALVALTEQGVPVFDLLGKAMGISADRVRELANSGKLGQDSIKLLVAELGKIRAGAAASELGDIDSQLTKLKDTGKEFLDTIAKSGALDFFREQLKELNAEVTDAAESGKLKQLAKSISDGIVSTAGAIKSAIGFVVDYSGALLELGKTYLIFRAIDIGASLINTAAAMEATARKTRTANVEAAAATTTFGKLGKTLNGLPTTIKIAVVSAALDFTLGQLIKLGDALSEQRATEREVAAAEDDRSETLARLADRIGQVKTQYQGFADVAIQSAEELRSQGAEQLRSYGEQLAGAQRFYQALVVEARAAGDAAGLADAKAKLTAVTEEIIAVNQQLAVTSTVGADASKGLSAGAAAIVAKLAEVRDDAKATSDFIQKAFDGFDFKRNITEVGDFAAAFDTVAAKGGKAAETLNATLLESLKKLSGEQLLQFQSSAIAALDGLGAGAEKTSATLQATLEAALTRLGVKAEDTGVKITKSGADTIATFTAVAENAQATAKTITAAFDAALVSAKTVDEAKALGAALQSAAEAGKVGLNELAAAGRDLEERIRTLTAAISPLQSQFEVLGIKSQAQLIAVRDNAREAFEAVVDGARQGTAAQEDVVRAFRAYADAARAAAADSSQSAREQVDDQLELQASILGITDALGKAGGAGKDAGDKTADAFTSAKDAIQGAADAADDLATNAEAAASGVEAAASSSVSLGSATQSIVLLSNEQLRLLGEIRDEFLAGAISGEEYARRVQVAMGGVDEALQRQQENLRNFQNQLDELNSDIAGQSGDTQTQENIRHDQKLRDLKDEFQVQGTLTSQQYQQLVDAENKLHALKLKNTQSEQQAASGEGGGSVPGGGGDGPPDKPGGGGARAAAPTVNITVNGLLDQKGIDDLGRKIKKVIDDINGRAL